MRINNNCNGGFNFKDLVNIEFDEFEKIGETSNKFVDYLKQKDKEEKQVDES